MRVDGLLDRGGIVGRSVALDTQRVHIDPVFGGRQRANRRRHRGGQRVERRGLVDHAHGAHDPFAGHDQPETETVDPVDLALAGDRLAAFSQKSEGRDIFQNGILEANFGQRTFLVADDDRGFGNALESAVFYP
jgi:hypothetical protein